jgi:hypothetical protein
VFAECSGWANPALDIESSPVIRTRSTAGIYVGSAAGTPPGTVYSVDAASGSADRTFVHGDGRVKGFVFPDRGSDTIYLATDSYVWSVLDDGTPSMKQNFKLSLEPTDPTVRPSSVLFVPGSH